MSSRGTHVRVMPETLAGLRQLIEEMDPLGTTRPRNRFWGTGPLTMAALIEELVRRELAHRERSRKAGRKRPAVVGEPLKPMDPPSIPPVIADPEGDAQAIAAARSEDWFMEFERQEKAGR